MTFLLRTMIACAFSGVLLAGGWFVAVGLTLGSPQHSTASPQEFVGYPQGHTFHDPSCRFVILDDKEHPVMWFPNEAKASQGREPCDECLTGQPPRPKRTLVRRQP